MNLLTHLQQTPYNLSRLARDAGVNPQYLHDIVKGNKRMSQRIAHAPAGKEKPQVVQNYEKALEFLYMVSKWNMERMIRNKKI